MHFLIVSQCEPQYFDGQRFTEMETLRGMRWRLIRILVATTAALTMSPAMPVALDAQLQNSPAAGVPRTPDGKPDVNAPAPRTPDGKPDLSGIWDNEHNRPCPPGGCGDVMVGQEFVNIGWSLKGGLPYQPWAADLVKSRSAENGKDDPVTRCLPAGVVHSHSSPLFRKVVQVPGLVVIMYGFNAMFRQIFTDGRPPVTDAPMPSFFGYSSGKWEGDTLVVQTSGFNDGQWLDRNGSPLTDAAKITERLRRVNYGRLEIEITVDDPKAYTTPWTVKLTQSLVPDTDFIDNVCLENSPHLIGK